MGIKTLSGNEFWIFRIHSEKPPHHMGIKTPAIELNINP